MSLIRPLTRGLVQPANRGLIANRVACGALLPPPVFNDQLALSRALVNGTVSYRSDPYSLIDFTLTEATNSYYVDYVNGNDSNNGTSAGTAWKTFAKANTSAVSPAVIYLLDKWVGYLSATASSYTWSGKFKIVGAHASGFSRWVGMRESYTAATFAWNSEGGGCYSTSAATTTATIFASLGLAMFDAKYPDADGGAMPIPQVTDAATCIATPGTQYHDAANSKKYVHLLDGRTPDPYDDWIYSRAQNDCEHFQSSDTGVILLENIRAYVNLGPASPAGIRYKHTTNAQNNSKFGAKNCFAYGSGGNGFEIYDAKIAVLSGCIAKYSRADNFNYHSFVTTGAKGEWITVYQYNCKSAYAGYDGFPGQAALGVSSNGSTCHDSIHIERMNCSHAGGNGAVIADVNGALSVNWAIAAGNPTGTASPKACFWHDNTLKAGSNNGMYLWGCSANDGGDSSIYLCSTHPQSGVGGDTGVIYVKHWLGQTNGAIDGSLVDWNGAPTTLADASLT